MNAYEVAQKYMAIVQKAGARHSAKDMGMVQEMHDRACELGAKCNCEGMTTHPMMRGALVLRHPGHDQKAHGNRHGVGGLREFAGKRGYQVRQFKDKTGKNQLSITNKQGDKMRAAGITEAKRLITRVNKEKRDRAADAKRRGPKGMTTRELHEEFGRAKTAWRRAEIADEMFGRSGFADRKVAKTQDEIPSTWETVPSPRTIGSYGKLAVFRDDNKTYGIGPIIQNQQGEYFTGTLGRTRRVKPEFVGAR